MAHFRLNFSGDKFLAADVTELILRWARTHPENFLVGPFRKDLILTSGMELSGDCMAVVDRIRRAHPSVQITDLEQ